MRLKMLPAILVCTLMGMHIGGCKNDVSADAESSTPEDANQEYSYQKAGRVWIERDEQGRIVSLWESDPENVDGDTYEGIYIEFYSDGALKMYAEYEDDELNGVLERYYETGIVKVRWKYEGGLRQGEATHWWPNGNLKSKEQFKDDEIVGPVQRWSEDGSRVDDSK